MKLTYPNIEKLKNDCKKTNDLFKKENQMIVQEYRKHYKSQEWAFRFSVYGASICIIAIICSLVSFLLYGFEYGWWSLGLLVFGLLMIPVSRLLYNHEMKVREKVQYDVDDYWVLDRRVRHYYDKCLAVYPVLKELEELQSNNVENVQIVKRNDLIIIKVSEDNEVVIENKKYLNLPPNIVTTGDFSFMDKIDFSVEY